MGRQKGKRYTPTSGYLVDKQPPGAAPEPPPPHKLVVPWLPQMRPMTFARPWAKTDMTAKELAASIDRSTSRNALLFCDTAIFSSPLDFAVWDVLLTRRLVITPSVWDEVSVHRVRTNIRYTESAWGSMGQ